MPGLAALFGGIALVLVVALTAITLLPVALAYVALRVQDSRNAEPDARLGLKTAFHMVHTLAILLILFGASIFMMDLLDGAIAKNPAFRRFQPVGGGLNEMQRLAFALIISGLLFGFVFWFFLLATNDSKRRAVRRVFVGGRMALCLLMTMFTVTGLLIVFIQKEPNYQATEALVGLLLVWFPAMCLHMILFYANITDRRAKKDADEDERPWRPAEV
jgi:hypothetical protein